MTLTIFRKTVTGMKAIDRSQAAIPRLGKGGRIITIGSSLAERVPFVFRGVQRGCYAGLQPTGKQVTAELMIFYRVNGGRIVERWLQMNHAA